MNPPTPLRGPYVCRAGEPRQRRAPGGRTATSDCVLRLAFVAATLLAGQAAAAHPAAALPITVTPLVQPAGGAERLVVAAPPLRLADGLPPTRSLPAAAAGAGDALAAMAAWNTGGERPRQIGFARPLPQPLAPRLDGGGAPAARVHRIAEGGLARGEDGGVVWGARIRVAGAYRLRLRLQAPLLPAGARLWVWGDDQVPHAFGVELRGNDGFLWTPSVAGAELAIEIALPPETAPIAAGAELPFRAAEVLELFPAPPPRAAQEGAECLVDAACPPAAAFPALATARHAVAHLEFVRSSEVGARAFLCTGTLLNDRDETTVVPYLLTANHCFATAASAASLEAFFDYFRPACGAAPPALKDVPRSSGARLLVTSEAADVTLVELLDVPPGRTFLGWTTAPLPQGVVIHRLSHPFVDGHVLPQSYTRALVDHRFGVCSGFGRPEFLYSRLQVGGTLGGSSGSPAMTGDGLVVGQLLGTCGGSANDPCDPRDREVDGALVASFEALAPFLGPLAPGACSPSATVLCLDGEPGDRRYRVEVRYATQQAGRLGGAGIAVPLPAGDLARGGVFWFFAPELPELLVKVVDGCAVNAHRWVFIGPATNVGLTVTVTDTLTGRPRVYSSPDLLPAEPVHDLTAFRCAD